MKTRFAVAVLLALALAAPIAHAVPQTYSTSFTATATNATKSFGFTATTVLVKNDGANEIFVRFNSAATAATTSIYIGPNTGRRFAFAASEGVSSVGVICSAAETAAVTVEAYGGATPIGVESIGPNTMNADDLTLVDALSVGGASTLTGAVSAGSTLAVTGTTTAAAITASGNITGAGLMVITPTAQTIADNGGGTAAAGTIAATVGVVDVTCNDTDGCALTLSETSAVVGSTLRIINVGTNNLTIADSAGVQETVGSLTLGTRDSVIFCYVPSYWTQCGAVVDVT